MPVMLFAIFQYCPIWNNVADGKVWVDSCMGGAMVATWFAIRLWNLRHL